MIHIESPGIIQILISILLIVYVIAFFLKQKIFTLRIVFLRTISIIALILILLGAWFESSLEKSKSVILIDNSPSMATEDVDEILRNAKKLVDETTPEIKFSSDLKDKTNIENAIRNVNASNVILISDGWENQGDARSAISKLLSDKIKIFPLVPDRYIKQQSECKISQLNMPSFVKSQIAAPISVTISNGLNKECSGILKIIEGSKLLKEQKIQILPNKDFVLDTLSDYTLEGIQKVSAIFEPIDENDKLVKAGSETKFLAVQSKSKILVLYGTKQDSRALSPILSLQKYDSKEIFTDTQNILDLNFSEYKSIIINNVPRNQIPLVLDSKIKEAVELGVGLIVFGGDKSFGLGGYKDGILESIFPVQSLPPQTEQKRLNVAVQLLIDKSKSMEQLSRLDFAKSASKEVINSLKPDDYLGLIGFDSEPFVVIPIGRLQDIKTEAISLVERFFPSGSTNLLKALQIAGRSVERAPAGRKHIIIVTDGRLPDAGPMYVELVKQQRITGITVSCVLLTDQEGTYPLKEMAQEGGGVFYVTNDPAKLPRIFLEDIKVSTGERTMQESTNIEIRKGPTGIKSTTLEQFPSLRGYVQTKPKESSDVELLIGQGNLSDPLLVSKKISKGKSIAFTSDIIGRWSDSWITWPKFANFITDIISSSSNDSNSETSYEHDVRYYLTGDTLHIEVSTFSKSIEDIKGSFGDRQISFIRNRAGLFSAEVTSVVPGDFSLDLTGNNNINLGTSAIHINKSNFEEAHKNFYNMELLNTLAGETKGEVNPQKLPLAEEIQIKRIDITPYLAGILIFSLLLEIALREYWRKVN